MWHMSGWREAAEFLGLRRNTALLLVALLLAGTGEKLWLGFVPKYLQTLGAGVFIIGLYDALQTLLGALYAYPGGWVTDRWGERRSLMLFSFLSLGGYLVVLLWQHWLAVVLGSVLFLAWSALSLPTTFTIVATSLHQTRHTMGIGVQSMVRRVPMMLGPLLGGWLITRYGWQLGIQIALLACMVLTLLTMLFQSRLADRPPPGSTSTEAFPPHPKPSIRQSSLLAVVRTFNPTLRELLVSDILIRFCERIPYAFVILWAMDHAGLSAQQFAVLVSIEMITAMVCYVPVAHLADKYGQRPFVLATFIFFTLFPLSLFFARTFEWLAVAFAVRGLKEFGEPARKALIIAQASPELRSRTYGAYYLLRDCIVTAGSFLGAWLWSIAPGANFLGAALLGLAGTLWFWWFVYRPRNPAQLKPSHKATSPTRSDSIMKAILLALCCCALPASAQTSPPLKLTQTIPLPGVKGRFDHFSIDTKGNRLFVAALGNNTVEVLDLADGKRLHSITGMSKPQGVLFLADRNELLVAYGSEGTLNILDATDFKVKHRISELPDADNVRLAPQSGFAWVGFGDGALAAVSPADAKLSATIKLAGHPESFQLEKQGSRIFVNVPDSKQIVVIDANKRSVLATWPMKQFQANFPMALDQPNHRLFIGCRSPARLIVLDCDTGKSVSDLEISGDTDDLFYDAKRKRIYISCGEGSLDVVSQDTADTYKPLAKIHTSSGARTCFFSADLDKLCLAVPNHGSQAAEIRVFEPQ